MRNLLHRLLCLLGGHQIILVMFTPRDGPHAGVRMYAKLCPWCNQRWPCWRTEYEAGVDIDHGIYKRGEGITWDSGQMTPDPD